MPSSTTNMGLYKKNPSTDGNDTFDINTMLNDNWDRIDSQVGGQLGNSAPTAVNLVNGLQVVTAPKGAPLENLRITGRTLVNLLGRDGGCEDVSKWTDANSTHVLDTTNKTNGNSGIKGVIASGSAALVHRQFTSIKSGKYYIALMDVKNGNAKEVHLDYNSTSSALVTDTTKFTTVYIKLNPSVDYTGNFHFIANGVVGQYGYFDSARLYEISQAEYNSLTTMTSTQITARYPYVDDVKHVNSPYVIKYGENLLPSFNEWQQAGSGTVAVTKPYTAIISAPDATQTFLLYDINLIGGQQYSLTGANVRVEDNGVMVAFLGNAGGTITFTPTGLTRFVFSNAITVPIGDTFPSVIFTSGIFTFTNPVLNIGSTAKPFKPRNDDMLAFPNVQLASSGDGTVNDTLFKRDGKYWRENRFVKDMVLDGSLAWAYNSNYTGFKRINLIVSGASTNQLLTKFDGKIVKFDSNLNYSGDLFGIDTTNNVLYVTISSADSGWGDSYTPTAQEIQAYFYGWRMYVASGDPLIPYNGSGNKAWTKRDTSGGTTTLPTSSYSGSTPYKLTYQLATPIVEEIQVDAGMSLHEGLNQIEVGQGVIVREKSTVVPYLGAYRIADTSSVPVSNLKYRNSKILSIFRNGITDKRWVIDNNAFAYGVQRAYIINTADYDPTATYEVSYIALDQYALSAPLQVVIGEYASNLKTVVDTLSTNQADQDARISANEILARQIYNVPQKTSGAMTLYVDATNGADNNDGSAGKPFKTIQRAIDSIPQIVNHTVNINVAVGTYSEDLTVRGFSGIGGLNILGDSVASTSRSVNSFTIANNSNNIVVKGFNVTTTANAITVITAIRVLLLNMNIVSVALSNLGVLAEGANVYIASSVISNKATALHAHVNGNLNSDANSGTGNTYATNARYGGKIARAGTQPSGLNFADYGGVNTGDVGVINPWGDNTFANRSCVSVYNSPTQNYTGNTTTKAVFGNVNFDNFSEYSTVNNRFTPRKTGMYLLTMTVPVSSPATNTPAAVWSYVNGLQSATIANGLLLSGSNAVLTGSVQIKLNANDYVEVYAWFNYAITTVSGALFQVTQIA